MRFELANFADGRTLTEICAEVSAEFGPLPLTSVARFFEDLATLELIELRRPTPAGDSR